MSEEDEPDVLRVVEELLRRSERALEEGRWDAALESAARIEALGHSSAYEIRARAQWGRGDAAETLQGLAQALAIAPGVPRLWQLLARFQIEIEELDEAEASLRNALRCEGAERERVGLQFALLHLRRGDLEQALEVIEPLCELFDLGLGVQPFLLHARLLRQMGRDEESLAVLDRTLDGLAERGEARVGSESGLWRATLLFERAKHRLELYSDHEGARRDAREAMALSPGERGAWSALLEDEDEDEGEGEGDGA